MTIIEQLNEMQGKLNPAFMNASLYNNILQQLIKVVDDYNLSSIHKKMIYQNLNYVNDPAKLTRINLVITDMKSEIAHRQNEIHQQQKLPSERKIRVFISHASADKNIVDIIINCFLLKAYNLKKSEIFYTSKVETGALIGGQWNPEIRDRLEEAELVIFILTEDFRKSPMCLDEIGGAWGLQKKHVVPLIIPPTQFSHFSRFINQTNGIDITEKENIVGLLTRERNDFKPLEKIINNKDIEALAQAFMVSLKFALRSKTYFLKRGQFYSNKSDVFIFDGSRLNKIPNFPTAVILGLNNMPSLLSKKAINKLEVGETVDSILLAPVYEIPGPKHWVLLNQKLHHIPNKLTRSFLAQFNKHAANPTKIDQIHIFEAVPKGQTLTSIKNSDISKNVKNSKRVQALFNWNSYDDDSGASSFE